MASNKPDFLHSAFASNSKYLVTSYLLAAAAVVVSLFIGSIGIALYFCHMPK